MFGRRMHTPSTSSKRQIARLVALLLFFTFQVELFGQVESKQQRLARLTSELQTGSENTRKKAAFELARFSVDGVPGLIEGLKTNTNSDVLNELVEALCIVDQDAIPSLIETLKQNRGTGNVLILRHGANALACIAEQSNHDIPALAVLIPVLIQELEDAKEADLTAMSIFRPLGEQKPPRTAIDALNDKLQGFDAAAHCLGRVGRQSKDAIPLLLEIAGNEANRTDGYRKIDSINLILNDLIRKSDTSANRTMRSAFEVHSNRLTDKDRRGIEHRIAVLDEIEATQKIQFGGAIRRYGVFIVLAIFLAGWLIIYFFKPIWLLVFYEFLPIRDARFTGVVGAVTISVEYVLTRLVFRPRVLDAWVSIHLASASQEFAKKQTVGDRRIYVPVAVFFAGRLEADFDCSSLRKTFDRNQSRILITGVGGAGKTSLACQVLLWAMSGKKDESCLGRPAMLPVLLEHDFVEAGEDALAKSISSQLSDLLDLKMAISDSMLQALLKHKRILVLIDGMSEMSEGTRTAILSGISRIPVNAIIITSRIDETVGQLKTTTIRPTRIKGNQLSSFVESYLTSLGEKELFEDEEFFEGCRQLSAIVGDRDITALLARLFVEQMVAKQKRKIPDYLPDNIPSLMLRSIEVLYARTPSANLPLRDVIRAATVIGWECVRKDFRPLPVNYDDVKQALSAHQNGEECLSYLKDKLKLVETTSYDQKIRFRIDPLAEYLAGIYLVEKNGGSEVKWRKLFESVNLSTSYPETIKGFLLALRDCCEVEKLAVPGFVWEQLGTIVKQN